MQQSYKQNTFVRIWSKARSKIENNMKPKYRVEAFIVPKTISEDDVLCSRNEIDDVKLANSKLKLECSIKESLVDESINLMISGEEKMINDIEPVKNWSEIETIDEPIYDVPSCIVINKYPNISPECKYERYENTGLIPPKIPVRTSSLMSIDERGETDGILEEFCFHGYKNGCSAPVQQPEQVSEEIFQANWLRRLEILREREANLGEKETLLQERERLLFKKEKELRILERLVKDKLKQAELYLKRSQSSQSIESTNFDARTRSSEGSLNPNLRSRVDKGSTEKEQSIVFDCEKTGGLKNPPNSKSSLWTDSTSLIRKAEFVKTQDESTKSSFPGISAYHSSMRIKPRPRISYDDLDSTLSADIGDSSFVITSRKFDPAVFKKPQAFTRSSSERRTKYEQFDARNSTIHKYPPFPGAQRNWPDEIAKRVGENILASQDRTVKYQDYGLIDKRIGSDDDEARYSYLNLERGMDMKAKGITLKTHKERPNSWNDEGNEWLQKKRQAYNIATMRSNENFENKENAIDSRINEREKAKKFTKKKDSKQTKKFTIFR